MATDTIDSEGLPLALAAVLAGLTVVLTVAGFAFSLVVLVPAIAMGVATFFVWYHATGRLERATYRRVQRNGVGADPGSGGFGAGPREEWRRPREEWQDPRTDGRGPRTGTRTGVGAGAGSGARTGARTQTRTPTASGPTPAEARSVLDVGRDASQADVKAAYREKVKEVHPDHGGDEAAFKRVTDAYDVLSKSYSNN